MIDFPRDFGRYALLGEIARGAYGVVYRALDGEIDRVVALKMLRAEDPSEAGRERFFREARLAARLRHPNIVHIFEAGSHDGRPYFTMELLEGESLSARIARGPLPPAEAGEIARTLAKTLAYAHARGVIHRDLKPSNVILTERGPVLTDFGVARDPLAHRLTETGELLGTPAYMAPEQIAGRVKEADERCDIYALGVVLYETLTGRTPFEGETFMELSEKIRHDDPAPPPAYADVVMKCLRKNPADRYASAIDLAEALRGPRRLWSWRAAIAAIPVAAAIMAALGFSRAPSPPRLTIRSSPSGASVRLGDRFFCETPCDVPLPAAGEHELIFVKAGYPEQRRRVRIGDRALAVDARLFTAGEIPAGMVYVPAGEYELGDRCVRLGGFFIDRGEVTNGEYESFLRGATREQPLGWLRNKPPHGAEGQPVSGVTCDDAAAFARSRGKRLPTADEWEAVLRGGFVERGGLREWVDGRIARGASWHDPPESWLEIRPLEGRSPLVGFRCVMDE